MPVIGKVCDKHPELGGLRYNQGNAAPVCVGCHKERIKRFKHRDKKYGAKCRQKTKDEVFEHYGGAKCALCGFSHPDALVLDHVDGGGGKLRKNKEHPWGGNELYRWLRANGYPEELKFRVLCFNCNAIESVSRLREEREKEWRARHQEALTLMGEG